MSEFTNVSVVKKANIYFEGKVTSRVVIFQDGSQKTLGIMLPGDYVFNTDVEELMEISAGKVDILLPGATEWQTFAGGSSFVVPAKAKFELRVIEIVDYCCSYMKA